MTMDIPGNHPSLYCIIFKLGTVVSIQGSINIKAPYKAKNADGSSGECSQPGGGTLTYPASHWREGIRQQ